MKDYHDFIEGLSSLLTEARKLPLGGFPPLPRPVLPADAPRVVLFSPHPDDEAVIGALPLRLMRQSGRRVVNVAVTQGSNRARQAARLEELRACCRYLGFDLVTTAENGLEKINPQTRRDDPEHWEKCVAAIAGILAGQKPETIFFPHGGDWNSTHIGVHHLLVDALETLGPDFSCFTVETETWGAMDDPNLMVESTAEEVADLMAALSFHVGEVERNPYHVTTPAWYVDNVRRGSEIVGGQGGGAPGFRFATLYRLRRWRDGGFQPILEQGRFLATADDPGSLLTGA